MAYKDDEIQVNRTSVIAADILGPFTFIVKSGRAVTQTYLSADELREHVAACGALLGPEAS